MFFKRHRISNRAFMLPLNLHYYMSNGARAAAWLLIIAIIFVPLELLFAVRKRKVFDKTFPSDLGFYLISSFVPPLLLAVPLALASYVALNFVPPYLRPDVENWPLWLRGLAAFVVADFGFYWGHRWSHEIPFLWRFHAVHHAPKDLYFLISSRAHPVDNAFIRICGMTPIILLGLGAPRSVEGTMIATLLMLAVTIWGFFIHANVRWRFGFFEQILATPAFHAWHHTLEEPRDRNFASMLPLWDWLFGTYHLPKGEWPKQYGVDTELPATVFGQIAYPLAIPRRTVVAAESPPAS